MSQIKKKCVVLYFKGKPVCLCELKELEATDFIKIKKECDANLQELESEIQAKGDAVDSKIKILFDEIKLLKGEED